MIVTWENQPWTDAYRRALLEADRSKRRGCIQEAKRVMNARIKELADSDAGRDELTAVNDALVLLRVWEKNVA
jgi:hypothetical protein